MGIREPAGQSQQGDDLPLFGPSVWIATVSPPATDLPNRLLGWNITVGKAGMEMLGAKFATTRRRAERKAQRWVDRLERDDERQRDKSFTVAATPAGDVT